MRANVSNHRVEHRRSLSLGNQAQRERYRLCRLAAFVVAMLRSVEKARIKDFANLRRLLTAAVFSRAFKSW
jgi:hypothetical protein